MTVMDKIKKKPKIRNNSNHRLTAIYRGQAGENPEETAERNH